MMGHLHYLTLAYAHTPSWVGITYCIYRAFLGPENNELWGFLDLDLDDVNIGILMRARLRRLLSELLVSGSPSANLKSA